MSAQSHETMPVFHDLKFTLADTPGVELDTEVAQTIAERVAQRDGGRRNHSHASSFGKVDVGIDGISLPLADEDERGYRKNLLLPADVLKEDPNPIFARHFQNTLDMREHANRMNIPGTIGAFTVLSTLFGGTIAALMSEGGLTTEEVAISAGIGVGTSSAVFGLSSTQNIYRRIVTDSGNSRIHNAHLERAAKLARKLELPPVIYST